MLTLSVVIISGMVGLYGWLTCVAAGVSVLRLLPSSTFTKHGLRLFSPRWELSQLLAAAIAAGLLAVFGHGSGAGLSSHVQQGVALIILAALLRSLLLLLLTYRRTRTGLRAINLLYCASSFLVPFLLGVLGMRVLTTTTARSTPGGWLLLVGLMVTVTALALSFVYFMVGRTPHDRLHQVSRWLNVAACASSIAAAEVILRQPGHRLDSPAFTAFLILLAGVAVLQAGLWFGARERYMWWYLSVCIIAAPLLGALANRPYALYPSLPLQTAYGSTTNETAVVVSAALVVVLGGIGILLWPLVHVAKKRHY